MAVLDFTRYTLIVTEKTLYNFYFSKGWVLEGVDGAGAGRQTASRKNKVVFVENRRKLVLSELELSGSFPSMKR